MLTHTKSYIKHTVTHKCLTILPYKTIIILSSAGFVQCNYRPRELSGEGGDANDHNFKN